MGLFRNNKEEYLIEYPERYDQNEKEVIVLTGDDVHVSKFRDDKYRMAGTGILGYIDVASDRLILDRTWIEWNLAKKEEKTKKLKYGIEKEKCYRLLVRESLPRTNFLGIALPGGRNLFVTKVLERECKEPRLDELLMEYRKVVTITLENGAVLTLDKSRGCYRGETAWLNDTCSLDLYVDGYRSESAESALETFEMINREQETWDKKAKAYAAGDLWELAEEWHAGEEDSSETGITEEEFARRIELIEIVVQADGDYEFVFSDDDLFYGHWIVVTGNRESGFQRADIEG